MASPCRFVEFYQFFFYDADDPDVTQNLLREITDPERNPVSTKHNGGAAGINSADKS